MRFTAVTVPVNDYAGPYLAGEQEGQLAPWKLPTLILIMCTEQSYDIIIASRRDYKCHPLCPNCGVLNAIRVIQ